MRGEGGGTGLREKLNCWGLWSRDGPSDIVMRGVFTLYQPSISCRLPPARGRKLGWGHFLPQRAIPRETLSCEPSVVTSPGFLRMWCQPCREILGVTILLISQSASPAAIHQIHLGNVSKRPHSRASIGARNPAGLGRVEFPRSGVGFRILHF